MPQRNSGKRTGNRTATRQTVVDDDDEEDESEDMSDGELVAQVRSALGRNNGNAEQLGLTYLRDLRRLRKLKNKYKGLYESQLDETPEGSIVLVDKEAAAIRKLRDERKLEIEKLDSLIGKLEDDLAKERKTNADNAGTMLYARIAENTGWNRDAIQAVVNNGQLHVEEREVEIDEKGKKVKKQWPHVRPKADDKAALVKMDDFVEQHQKYMWGALRTGGPTQQDTRRSGSAVAPIDGTPAPREGTQGGDNPVKAFVEKSQQAAAARPNPLSFIGKGPKAPAAQ